MWNWSWRPAAYEKTLLSLLSVCLSALCMLGPTEREWDREVFTWLARHRFDPAAVMWLCLSKCAWEKEWSLALPDLNQIFISGNIWFISLVSILECQHTWLGGVLYIITVNPPASLFDAQSNGRSLKRVELGSGEVDWSNKHWTLTLESNDIGCGVCEAQSDKPSPLRTLLRCSEPWVFSATSIILSWP